MSSSPILLLLLLICSLSPHFSPLIFASATSATSASQPALSIHHNAASVLEPMSAPIMMEHTGDVEMEATEMEEDTSSDAADDTGEGDDGDDAPQQRVHLSVDSMSSSFASATAQVTTTFFTSSASNQLLPNASYLSSSAMKFGALIVGTGATTECSNAKIQMFQSLDSGVSWEQISSPGDFVKNGALYASSMVTYGSYLVMQSGLWCAPGSASSQLTDNVYYQKAGSKSWSQYDSPWGERGRSVLIAKTYPTPGLWQFGGFNSNLKMPNNIWSTSDPSKGTDGWTESSSTVPWQSLNGGLYIDFVAALTSTDLVVVYINGAALYISNINLSAWTQIQPVSSWFGQSGANRLFGSMASIKGTLVYVGGVTMSTLPASTNLTQPPPAPSSSVVYQSDVWISNDLGRTWLLAASNTDTSGYSPRCWPILQVNEHQLTIAGGYGLNSAISSYMPLQDVYQTYL